MELPEITVVLCSNWRSELNGFYFDIAFTLTISWKGVENLA